jgi:hypothetical protein
MENTNGNLIRAENEKKGYQAKLNTKFPKETNSKLWENPFVSKEEWYNPNNWQEPKPEVIPEPEPEVIPKPEPEVIPKPEPEPDPVPEILPQGVPSKSTFGVSKIKVTIIVILFLLIILLLNIF